MNLDTEKDKELYHVIVQTLHSCLSPDKVIIDQAQAQLFVLQIREGIFSSITFTVLQICESKN